MRGGLETDGLYELSSRGDLTEGLQTHLSQSHSQPGEAFRSMSVTLKIIHNLIFFLWGRYNKKMKSMNRLML